MLQPILFASRQSCHGEGNDYLQTGDHSFHFSLTSTHPDWRNGYKSGIQGNEELLTVVAPNQYLKAVLPEEKSLFGIDAPNVIITTIKKAENDPNTVIRMVEMEGQDTQTTLDTFKQIEQVYHTNLIEEPLQKIEMVNGLKINIGHNAIETFIMK